MAAEQSNRLAQESPELFNPSATKLKPSYVQDRDAAYEAVMQDMRDTPLENLYKITHDTSPNASQYHCRRIGGTDADFRSIRIRKEQIMDTGRPLTNISNMTDLQTTQRFEVPQYEKDLPYFSAEFLKALNEFMVPGKKYILSYVVPGDTGHVCEAIMDFKQLKALQKDGYLIRLVGNCGGSADAMIPVKHMARHRNTKSTKPTTGDQK